MGRNHWPESGVGLLGKHVDSQLLYGAQEYLRSRKNGRDPTDEQELAWQRFYQLYNPLLKRYVAGRGRTGPDPEECLQESWKKIVEGLPGFRSDGTQAGLCAWMYRLVRNAAANLRRYRRRHSTKPLGPQGEVTLPCQDADPVAEAEQREAQAAVRQVLELLQSHVPELTYLAFYERYIEEKTVQEIAAELKQGENAIRIRLWKAKQEFRRIFEHVNSIWGGGREGEQALDLSLTDFSQHFSRVTGQPIPG